MQFLSHSAQHNTRSFNNTSAAWWQQQRLCTRRTWKVWVHTHMKQKEICTFKRSYWFT